MSSRISYALLCVCLVVLSSAYRQEFTFYDRFRSQAEDSITLTRHYPNVTGNWDFFLRTVRGRCVKGEWATYLEENYENIHFRMLSCSDHAEGYFGNVKSLRYFGASDTTTKAVSFYPQILFQGQEYYSEDATSSTGPEFEVNSIAVTGQTAWTLWTGANFTGRMVCLPGSSDDVFLLSRSFEELGITKIGSFVVGCDV